MVAGPAKMVTKRCHAGRFGYAWWSVGSTSSARFMPRISTKPPNGMGAIWKSVPDFFERQPRTAGPKPMLKRSTRMSHRRATT